MSFLGTGGEDLVDSVADLVRAVPGVRTIYSAEPLAATLVGAAISTATGVVSRRPLIIMTDHEDATAVSIRIGTDDSAGVPDVARLVYEVVAEFLRQLGFDPQFTTIDVEVASIG